MPYRALEALMAATGVEWQVVETLTRRDIDIKRRTVHARGGKNAWRNRVVRGTELWAWRIFAEYARDFTENALLFEGLRHSAALRTHKRIGKTLGMPPTTLHDWRHTYAVNALRQGYRPQVVAHQLGHRDAYLVITRYGRHTPSLDDYEIHGSVAHATHALG
jgi:integrase